MSRVERAVCRSAPWRRFTTDLVLPWALQGLRPTGDALEIGGGNGAMADATARRFPDVQVIMTDIDPVMVAAARQRLVDVPNASVIAADATDLPFETVRFDVVLSHLMLHHVIHWEAAVTEAARVLRPGGQLVGYDLDRSRVGELIHVVDRSPHRLVSRAELASVLSQAGFDVVEVRRGRALPVMRFAARKPA